RRDFSADLRRRCAGLGMFVAFVAFGVSTPTVAAPPSSQRGSTSSANASESGPGSQAACVESALGELAKVEAMTLHFKEKKTMALLAVPLENEGCLVYLRPRALARFVDEPVESKLRLEGSTLRLTEQGKTREIDVGTRPELHAVVELFVSVLAGHRKALDTATEGEMSCEGERWRVRLVPRDSKVRRLVSWLEVEGEGRRVRSMHYRDGNGDETQAEFSEVRFEKAPSAERREALLRGA